MSIYYTKRDGRLYGPFSLEQVTKCFARDIFHEEDLISEDQIHWITIQEFKEKTASGRGVKSLVPEAAGEKTVRPGAVLIPLSGGVHGIDAGTSPAAPPNAESAEGLRDDLRLSHLKNSKNTLTVLGILSLALFLIPVLIWCVFWMIRRGWIFPELFTMDFMNFFMILSFVFIGFSSLCGGMFFLFGYIGLFRCWQAILPEDAETTPGKAVGFLFLPLFNLYWIFVAFFGLSGAINRSAGKIGLKRNLSFEGGILSCCILIVILFLLMFCSFAAFLLLMLTRPDVLESHLVILCDIIFYLVCLFFLIYGILFLSLVSAACRLEAMKRPAVSSNGVYAPVRPERSVKKRVVYILLGIFLGGLGIHNFYAGYAVRGITQLLLTLLTCGLGALAVGIWVILELCIVSVDACGIPME